MASKAGEVVLDAEALKDQEEPLSEEQNAAIRDNALKSVQKREKEGRTDDDDEDPFKAKITPSKGKKDSDSDDDGDRGQETAEQKKLREDEEAAETEKQQKAEQEAEAAEKKTKVDAAMAKKEAERNDDEKALVKEHTESLAAAREAELVSDAQEYAIKFGLTEEQARKEVERIYGIRDNFKGDPKELSKALLHTKSKLTQVEQELAGMKKTPKLTRLKIDGKELSEEDSQRWMVNKFREHNPDLTDGLEDDKVLIMAEKELANAQRVALDKHKQAVKEQAEVKRRDLVDQLPEADKRFAADIKGVLARVDDSELMSEDFDLSEIIYMARGKYYHKHIKEEVEKARAEALKDKKILGKQGGDTSAGGQTVVKKGTKTSLTPDEQERAMDMYQSLPHTPEEKYALYENFLKETGQRK